MSSNNTNVESNIVALVQDFKKTQEELKAKLKADGENELKVVFKSIFDKHPGLKAFAYVGYTPGFNDGDPCTHSGYSYVGDFHTYTSRGTHTYWTADCYEEIGWDNLGSHFLNEGADLDDTDTPLDFVNKECATLEQASKDVADIEEVIEMVYDTDYLIKISLTADNEVVVEHDYYECGY